MKRLFSLLLISLASGPSPAGGQTPDVDSEIKAVVDQFAAGLAAKDSAHMVDLFEYPEIPVFITQSGLYDGGFRPGRTTGIAFVNLNRMFAQHGEKVFANIEIEESGGVASMRADYEFRVNGTTTNAGREMWTLINTSDGWRIISIAFSN